MVARGEGGVGLSKMGEREKEIQDSSYRMSKSWEQKAEHKEYNNIVIVM